MSILRPLDRADTTTRLARLSQMDLSGPLSKTRSELGWTSSQCAEADLWYRRFWHAIILYPTVTLVPNRPIDEVWHLHVLDTAAYRRDCMHVLGFFLDHYPYYGLRGDAAVRDDSFGRTNAIYRQLFGTDCTTMSAFDAAAGTTCGDGPGCQNALGASCGGEGIHTGPFQSRSCGQNTGCETTGTPYFLTSSCGGSITEIPPYLLTDVANSCRPAPMRHLFDLPTTTPMP